MDPKPFTYEHFIQTVKEENDKSLNTMTFEYKKANAELTLSHEALIGQIDNSSFPFEGNKQLKE